MSRSGHRVCDSGQAPIPKIPVGAEYCLDFALTCLACEVPTQCFTSHRSKNRKKGPMTGVSESRRVARENALLAIAVGGLTAGALDLTAAFVLFGGKVPLAVAAGLIGPQAIHGGNAVYLLGVLLHFFIAFSAAAVYYGASRRLAFLKEHPLVCGLFYGIAVHLVMQFIVLPLSALHARGPYQYRGFVQGLLIHMILIGLPISFSVRRFAK
jgi:hypothetical protein